MAQWMQCSFIQTVPTWADAACNLRPDTHDGFDSNRKREDEERGAKERLRAMLESAIDPQPIPVPEEAVALAEPFYERLESGRIEIDWAKIERETTVQAQLYAYAEEFERKRLELDDDDEDVGLLLWH